MVVKQYQLRGHSGPVTDQVIKLSEQEITLGRDLANDVVIADSEVSRIHARLSWQPEAHLIRDLKSTNGTWINGRPVLTASALSIGDLLTLGKVSVFVYELVPVSELDTTREDFDPDALITSTLAMPVSHDAVLAARQVLQDRLPRPVLPAEQSMPPPASSPGRLFHQKYVAQLQAGDVESLLNQYHADATLLCSDRGVSGTNNIREFFQQYLGGLGRVEVRATGQYVEGRDSILCETRVETADAVVRVQDVFVLSDGKATHHFTCTVELTPRRS